jgi:hypothetical protein
MKMKSIVLTKILPLALGVLTWFAVSMTAMADKLLDYHSAAGMLRIGKDPERPDAEMFHIASPRSLSILSGVLLPPFMDYLLKDLGYVTERPYTVLSLEISALWDRKSTLGTSEDLALALTQNTDLNAMVLRGYHDLGATYFVSRYVLEQSLRSPSARKRLSFGTYPGGHMFYLRTKSRAECAADVRRFFEEAPWMKLP